MADPATRRKFEALVSAAFIDGILAAPERQVLRKHAGTLRLSTRDVDEIIAQGEQRKLSITLPPSSEERDALLEDLIEVVSADGRVEAPEYHLLARVAETLRIPLPELRSRVNRRMQAREARDAGARRETVRQAAPAPKRPDPPPPPAFEPPKFAAEALPPMAPPPASPAAEISFPKEVKVADLPPVTLQLLRQSIMFDSESDSIANIGRTLGVTADEAAEVRRKIVAAFPDLKPGSQQIRPARR
jgi:uncharacterized tellurite resistance protein B-like protein